MPTDLFFLTNNYSTFLAWTLATRQRLLLLNRLISSNGSFLTSDSAKNFLAVKALALIYKTKAKYEKSKQDEVIKKHFIEIKKDAALIKDFNIKEAHKLNANLIDELDRPVADRLLERAAAEKKISDELKGVIYSSVGDDGNPTSIDKRIKNTIEFPDYLKPDPTVLPDDVVGITTSITDNILNPARDSYSFLSNNGNKEIEQRGWIKPLNGLNNTKPFKVDDTKFSGNVDHEYSEYARDLLKNSKITTPTGTYKFFIEKLHGRHYTNAAAEPFKINPITNQKEIYTSSGVNYSNRKVFAAFIDNYNDSYSVGVESYNFIGRGEKTYTYSSTERKITMQFTILTDHAVEQLAAIDLLNEKIKSTDENDILSFLLNKSNLHWGQGTYDYDSNARLNGGTSTYFDTPETTWQKLTFLAQCCYPYYRTDGKMKEQPMVRIRIGDFYDVICHIGSLNYTLNSLDVPYIDFSNGPLGEQPIGIQVTIDAYVVHDYEPSSEYHGFYHRKQFDNTDSQAAYEAKVWGIGLSKDADAVGKLLKKNSPLSLKNILNTGNFADLLTTTDFQEIQRDIKVFKKNFAGLGNKATNLFDHVKKIKLKNIFEAITAIKSKTDFLTALQEISNKVTASPENLKKVEDFAGKFGVPQSTFDAIKTNTTNNLSKITDKVNHAIDQTKLVSKVTANLKNVISPQPKTIGEIISKDISRDIITTIDNSTKNNLLS